MPEINENDFKSNELREIFKAGRQSFVVQDPMTSENPHTKFTPSVGFNDMEVKKSSSGPDTECFQGGVNFKVKKHSNAPSTGSLNGSFVSSPRYNFDYLCQNSVSYQLKFDNDDSVTLVPPDKQQISKND